MWGCCDDDDDDDDDDFICDAKTMYIWCRHTSYLLFLIPPYFLNPQKVRKKVRKFATKIASRQNSVNFCWRTWYFGWHTWYFGCLTWYFVGFLVAVLTFLVGIIYVLTFDICYILHQIWCMWYFVCYIFWIDFAKKSPV